MLNSLLVSCECGHTHLASQAISYVLPASEKFMISIPKIGEKLIIQTHIGSCLTSPVREIKRCPSLVNNTTYLRITTENSVLSLISYS